MYARSSVFSVRPSAVDHGIGGRQSKGAFSLIVNSSLCWVVAMFLGAALSARSAEEQFPLLCASDVTYTNAVVTRKTGTHLFIMHQGGMASVKLAECDAAIQTHFGYVPPPPIEYQTNATALAMTEQETKTLRSSSAELFESDVRSNAPMTLEEKVALGGILVFQILFSFCCWQICRRAGYPSSVLVWIPILQYLALFKAAGVSRLWFFIPIASVIAWFSVCMRLCDAFHQSKILGLVMFFPGTTWFGFLYLSWVTRAEDHEPLPQPQYPI
jgi:hypothetical protein